MTADHPYTSRFHRLKVIMASGHKLVVPEDWVDGVTPKGNAWIGDGLGNYELQIVGGADAVEGGDERMPEAVKKRVAMRLQSFSASGQIGDSKLGRINGCIQIEAVTDDPRAPTARSYNWIRLVANGDELMEIGFHLLVRRELWDRPKTEDLIELFGEQVASFVEEWVPSSLDLGRLRTVHPFGFLTFRVPARWIDEWDADAGMWFCGEDDPDTGSLWVDYKLHRGRWDEDAMAQVIAGLGPEVSWRGSEASERPIGYRCFTETDPKDGILHYHHWHVLHLAEAGLVSIFLSLVLGPEQVSLPEYQQLIAGMQREAVTLEIGPLPD